MEPWGHQYHCIWLHRFDPRSSRFVHDALAWSTRPWLFRETWYVLCLGLDVSTALTVFSLQTLRLAPASSKLAHRLVIPTYRSKTSTVTQTGRLRQRKDENGSGRHPWRCKKADDNDVLEILSGKGLQWAGESRLGKHGVWVRLIGAGSLHRLPIATATNILSILINSQHYHRP